MNSQFILSDHRLKECICPTKCQLENLDRIQFVSYDYTDKTKTGCDIGIIAQDVAEVYPNMVIKQKGVIPCSIEEVNHTLTSNNNVRIDYENISTMFDSDDKMMLIVNQHNNKLHLQYNILATSENSIEIECWSNYSPDDVVTIYGKLVNDLHSVDAAQMGMLGAACAKELYHIVKEQSVMIKTLQEQVTALQAKLS